MIIQRTGSGRYEATQYSPKSDGVTRVGYTAFGDTAIEAIDNCMHKLGLVESIDDQMDDYSDDRKVEEQHEQYLPSERDSY